jgi:hypothetical protein
MSSAIDPNQILNNYLSAWNTLDAAARSLAMAGVVAEDCYYADAHLPEPLRGRELHDRFIDRFREKFPDLRLQLVGEPQSHHGYFRFRWELIKTDNSVFVKGCYFGEINETGQIEKVIGFVDS